MNRKLIINSCGDCPFFDNDYYDYNEICDKLDRKIEEEGKTYNFPIPDDCLLESTQEDATE